MSGSRKQLSSFRRVVLPTVATAVSIAAVASVTVVALSSTGAECQGSLPLRVVVTPAAFDVVNAAAQDYQGTRPVAEGRCVQVQVESRNTSDVALELPTAQINPQSLWIPDSSMWATEVQHQTAQSLPDAPTLSVKASLGSSPLLLAGSQAKMAKIGTSVSWSKVLNPSVAVSLPDPTNTSEGLASVLLIRTLLGNPDGTPKAEVVGTLLRVGRSTVPSVRDAFTKATTDLDEPLLVASEQSIIAHNRSEGITSVVGSQPKEGTLSLDFPLVRVTHADEQPGTDQAAEDFERVLRSAQTTELFSNAGFRTPTGDAPAGLSTEKNGVSGDGVANVKTPSADQVSELLRTWSAINLDTRMLTVFDVSGSMAEKGVNGKTRIESATEAASTALAMLPDTTDIGLWAFSTDKNPPHDWIELVPTGPLGEPLNGVTRRKLLEGGVGQLSALAGGGTAINDTVLAAYRQLQATYQPGKLNEVVLFTDGRNDDNSSITTAALIDTLNREADPARPVPIFTIGLGEEADMQSLRQISEASGGEAFQAAQPQDIRDVLLAAIGHRRCRPNC